MPPAPPAPCTLVEEALQALNTQTRQLPDILTTLCRKAAAVASSSGFSSCHEVRAAEEESELVQLLLRAAGDIQDVLDDTTEGQALLDKVQSVLFGASKDQQQNEEEAEVLSVADPSSSSSRHKERQAEKQCLAPPDVVFLSCPLTQEPFKTPVSQRFSSDPSACCHVFEEEAILHHMRSDSLPCPFAGCKGTVRRSELRRDVETEEHMRRMRLREAEEAHRKDVAVAAEAARLRVRQPE